MPTTLTDQLARLIVGADPARSPGVLDRARDLLIDFLACALAGAGDPVTGRVAGTLAPAGEGGAAVLIGQGRRADPFTAALINGTAGHALDYDDVQSSVRGHPSTVILPALLAAAEGANTTRVSATDLLAAYVVGLETMARLGLMLGSGHYEAGFHATATLGPIGAAAALAHLGRFDPQRTAIALGLAATQASGLRLQFGFDAKPLHAGFAARAGLTAARLAAAGFDGAPAFLDGPISFAAAFGLGQAVPERAVADFGAPWQILTPGVVLKAFPCCTASHCAAEAALALRVAGIGDPAAIAAIRVVFPLGGDAALVVRQPTTGIEARFSVEYVVAAALITGGLSLGLFDDRPVRPDIAALAGRVVRDYDRSAPRLSTDPATRFTVVEITLTDGRTVTERCNALPSLADPAVKFRDATEDDPRLAAVPALVRAMTTADDLAAVLDLLALPPPFAVKEEFSR